MPQELSAEFKRDLSNWDYDKCHQELDHRRNRLQAIFYDVQESKRDLSNEETNDTYRLDAECDALAVRAKELKIKKDVMELQGNIAKYDEVLNPPRRTQVDSGRPSVSAAAAKETQKLFANLGEQMLAVHAAANPGRFGNYSVDERLASLAPAGNQTGVDSDGGYLVQKDFSSTILKRMYEMGAVLSRVNRVGVSGNGLKIPVVAETSRATGSRYGGIQVYRVGEGNSGTYTRPKLAMIELTLKKLMALYTCTDELLADAPAMAQLAQQAVSEEFTFKIENEIFRGTGAGEMLGFLNSPALVTVTEGDAAVDQITSQNVRDMWARLWARSRPNAVWFINQDCEPSLMTLNSAVGTAGGDLVYLPPGGYSAAPYGTLFGRPVIPVEYCATVGDVADICLVDLSQYLMIEKGGMTSDSSIHVYFDSGQQAFRWTMRNDGQPTWHAPLTPFQGTNTLSPFVVAATRT